MVIAVGFGRCGCRLLSDPLLVDYSKIFIDLDSSLEPNAYRSSVLVKDAVVSDWFDVAVSSDISPALIKSAISAVRRFSENADRTDDISLFLSPSGASGGGLASLFVEALSDHSYHLKSASVVFPHTRMYRRGQQVNTIMTLGHLSDHVSTTLCFDNTVLLESDFANVNSVVMGCSVSLGSTNIPEKFCLGNLFVRKITSDNVLIQLETFIGRRPKFVGRPTVVLAGHPQIPGSLVRSVDSVFGNYPGAAITELQHPIIGLGSLAIAYRDTATFPKLVESLIGSACSVSSNHREWFSETVEKLRLEFL